MNATIADNGMLDVLNVGTGHLTFRFDKGHEDEVEKAKKVIADMLKRGYMIFVKVDGEQKRVRAFDPLHEEYIVEEPEVIPEPEQIAAPAVPQRRGRGRPPGSKNAARVPMRRTVATGIGPTAGG